MILTAVKNEAQYFLENFNCIERANLKGVPHTVVEIGQHRVAIVVGGIGTSFAASVATAALFALKPKALFFSGSAGSSLDHMHIGDIVIVEEAYEVEIQGLKEELAGMAFEVGLIHPAKNTMPPSVYTPDADLLAQAKAYTKQHPAKLGMAASTNQFPSPKSLFESMRQMGAIAVDMETSALYQVGWLYDVPVLAFRCISNKLSETGDYVEHEEPVIEAEYAVAKYVSGFIASL